MRFSIYYLVGFKQYCTKIQPPRFPIKKNEEVTLLNNWGSLPFSKVKCVPAKICFIKIENIQACEQPIKKTLYCTLLGCLMKFLWWVNDPTERKRAVNRGHQSDWLAECGSSGYTGWGTHRDTASNLAELRESLLIFLDIIWQI